MNSFTCALEQRNVEVTKSEKSIIGSRHAK